ncbi:Uncharacterised protein [Mycobacteroides abscessus subsp. abscessus]|nr:Uncharacterised protein [Mycobacteroides abscessus subsp. abscessus]
MEWTKVMFYVGMALIGAVAVTVYPTVMAWLAH